MIDIIFKKFFLVEEFTLSNLLVQVALPELPTPGDGSLYSKLGHLSVKMCKHWMSLTGRLDYHNLIVRLDEFTGRKLETLTEGNNSCQIE